MHGSEGGVLRSMRTKVFCFFFSKKMLPFLLLAENPDLGGFGIYVDRHLA